MEESTLKPVFVDNRDGNTLAKAIRDRTLALKKTGITPQELCIASAYFNPAGMQLLSGAIDAVPRVRILLGADPVPESHVPVRVPGDPREPEFTRAQVRGALEKSLRTMRRDRNLEPFTRDNQLMVRQLPGMFRSGKVEVRRFTKHFLHAKAYIFRGPDEGVMVGSSNLTYAGLSRNLELCLGHYDQPLVGKVIDWYEELWEEAEPFDLISLFEEILEEIPPYLVYLRVLWQLYGDELTEEERETGTIPITTFQKHGVWRALRILEDCGGVIIADGVGLGKTFTAGEIVSRYQERRQRVLLICPAALRDTTWREFKSRFQLYMEIVSFEQLANDVQLGGKNEHLDRPLEEYSLVIIDEAHNYRNPDTPTRAQVLRNLLAGKRRDVVMLSATPVNNSLWDLYHLIRFFLKQDAHLANRGVLSMRKRFEDAMRKDPFSLSPDLLYPIIDATTVKRTRQFVKKHYKNESIRGPDGKSIPIVFPKPHALSVYYELEPVLPGFFDRFQEALMPPTGLPKLTMARYMPEQYPKGGSRGEETALVGLLRSGLLKRFESSSHAFALTTEKMANEHEVFLQALEQSRVIRAEFFREIAATEDPSEEEFQQLLESSEAAEDASGYDVDALKEAVRSDLELLRELSNEAASISPEQHPKLAALVEELANIAEQAINDSKDREEEIQNRKVIVFSYFKDTLDWIEDFITKVVKQDERLACYRERIVSVSGEKSRHGIQRTEALHGFAPVSTEAPAHLASDRFDLLLATDVLAEGLNLQQCRNIVNYDLPWNPMRLVQRHGRIDRINSLHRHVYLRTYFPEDKLNDLLKLEERVRRKLAQAAASIGVETTPIEAGASGRQSFAESRKEIDDLYKGDSTIFDRGGTASAAQSGEEYRQELRKASQDSGFRRTIDDFPWKAGSGMVKGNASGWVFCAVVGDGSPSVRHRLNRTYLRFVPRQFLKTKKSLLQEGGEPSEEDGIIGEIGTCLRLLECSEETTRDLPDDLEEEVYEAWERARENIYLSWFHETDPANLQPEVRKLNREVAEWLRGHPPQLLDVDLDRIIESVESPWPRRDENQLRLVWNQEFDDPLERSKRLVEEIEMIGAEPFAPPDPLPPIEREEIHLVTWMAIVAERSREK